MELMYFTNYKVVKNDTNKAPYTIKGPKKEYVLGRNLKDPHILFIAGKGNIRGYTWFVEVPGGLKPYR